MLVQSSSKLLLQHFCENIIPSLHTGIPPTKPPTSSPPNLIWIRSSDNLFQQHNKLQRKYLFNRFFQMRQHAAKAGTESQSNFRGRIFLARARHTNVYIFPQNNRTTWTQVFTVDFSDKLLPRKDGKQTILDNNDDDDDDNWIQCQNKHFPNPTPPNQPQSVTG